MAQTKMFRDRVVSLEQTYELGEKYLEILTGLVSEALPGFVRTEFELSHEDDLFVVSFQDPASGELKKVSFTRMVLADSGCVPALHEAPRSAVRTRIVECVRAQSSREEILVTFRAVMDEADRTEAEQVEAEWRKKNEVMLAARRAEDERRERERRLRKQQEEARHKALRDRERQKRREAEGPAAAGVAAPQPRGRGRRRGGAARRQEGAPSGAPGASAVAMEPGAAGAMPQGRPQQNQPRQPRPPRPPRPPRDQRARSPQPVGGAVPVPPRAPLAAPPPSSSEPGPQSPGTPRPEGTGGRRRRRRGRGGRGGPGGGPQPGGTGAAGPASSGGGD